MDKLNKNKILVFCHHPQISVLVAEDHVLSQMRYIQGTCLFMPEDCIEDFVELFGKKVNECLANGYIGSDEKIFDLCYLENPNLFQLEVSSWREYFDRYK
jgi:hypothetical protein